MIREIQTFLNICDSGTFAAAAEQQGITQSAVSAQIKNLEKNLGVVLFDRNRRGAILSVHGERVLPLARQIVNLFAQMSDTPAHSDFSGSLKLGIQPALQNAVLGKLLPALSENTRIHLASNAALLDDLNNKRLDVAILVRPDVPLSHDYVVQTLHHDACFLLTKNADKPQNYQNILSKYPLLAYDSTAFGNAMLTQFFRQHGLFTPFFTTDDANTLILLIQQGLGVGVLPQSCLNHVDVSGLVQIAVPVSREWVVVSLNDNVAHAQTIINAWQNDSVAHVHSWQNHHAGQKTNLGLNQFLLSSRYRS